MKHTKKVTGHKPTIVKGYSTHEYLNCERRLVSWHPKTHGPGNYAGTYEVVESGVVYELWEQTNSDRVDRIVVWPSVDAYSTYHEPAPRNVNLEV